MAIARWEPFREMEGLQRQIDYPSEEMMAFGEEERHETISMPTAEIQETENDIKLCMNLSGIDAKKLNLQVSPDAVSISGQPKSQFPNEDGWMGFSDYNSGKFKRVIFLPTRIENQKVKAEFQNNVLCLTMPKSESERTALSE